MTQHLSRLLCGETRSPGTARAALAQLEHSLHEFTKRLLRLHNNASDPDLLPFGPFCARVVLENGCAAIMGRFDSFRLIYLAEFQSQPSYDVGRRARSSFSWTGDVMPEAESPEMWSINHDHGKVSRALFSRYADHVFWKPAVETMLDFVATRPVRDQYQELISLDAETFVTQARGRGSQLHSTLSKGVHWEFFSSVLLFDEPTTKTLIRDTCMLMAQLALASHFVPTACGSLAPVRALQLYASLRRCLQ